MGVESHSTDAVEVNEHVRLMEKEDKIEMEKHKKGCKGEKKSKGAKDAEPVMGKKGALTSELTGVYGEDGCGDVADIIERKSKKRKKNKNRNEAFEVGNNEVESNENKKWPEGRSVYGRKGETETCEEMNKKKPKRNRDSDIKEGGQKDRKGVLKVFERKRANDDDSLGWKDTCGENKLNLRSTDGSTRDMVAENKYSRKKKSGTLGEGHNEDFTRKSGKKKKKKSGRKEGNDGDIFFPQQDNLPVKYRGKIRSTEDDGKEPVRSKYRKENNYKGASSTTLQDPVDNDSSVVMHSNKIQSEVKSTRNVKKRIHLVENGSDESRGNEEESAKKLKNKKIKLVENGSDEMQDHEVEPEKMGKKVKPNRSRKKVRFSGEVDVFPLPEDSNTDKGNDEEDQTVRGKRFTHEEDDIIKEAVDKYILEHDLGDEGLDMVLNCKKHPNLKGCWKEIGSAIPYRPYLAIYYRAQILFRRSESREWTQEEYNEILKYQEQYGNQWKALADELGKHRWHVKDTWRRIKFSNVKKGHWSQGEYQKLFDLVNMDLQLKVSEEKRSKHGMLRDNIAWTSISDRLSTRNHATCCVKWYRQLTSPMVAEGIWADIDDYRLLGALYSLDATCMEDVSWDNILEDRSGDVCQKRWKQMVLHIGQHGNKSFAEQVEVLAQRYCPRLLEAREAWDSKPRVP